MELDTRVLPAPSKLSRARPELVEPKSLEVFFEKYIAMHDGYDATKVRRQTHGDDYLNGWFVGANTLRSYVEDNPANFMVSYESAVARLAKHLRMLELSSSKSERYLEGLSDYYHRLAFGIPEDRFTMNWDDWQSYTSMSEDETRRIRRF